ncbi:pyruvate decarboxylase [Amanita muscaria]
MASEKITISNYLLTRLEQLGVKSMFGVPGDFNLGFLDVVEDHPTIDWIGNCNELNAAYAADGYARVKEHSIGAVTTTFGVGELSAINGIAGAFSEMVPVLHIVGVPSTMQQKAKPMLHHTLGNGRYNAYVNAAKEFTVAQAVLADRYAAPSEIDRVLTKCITEARPVYLALPTDLVQAEVSSEGLRTPLSRDPPPHDPQIEDFVLDLIHNKVQEVKGDVVVLVDACAIRHDVRKELYDFLKATGFPVYAAPMGKTAIDEDYERYGGIYVGTLTEPAIKERVESADLILSVGALKSDFNTGNFSYNIPPKRTIELHSHHTQVQYAIFGGIGMKRLLPKLAERLKVFKNSAIKIPVPPFKCEVPQTQDNRISHSWFWPRLENFFKQGDVIVTETGTSNFGILDVPLPRGSKLVNQILWGSIGWSLGSAVGAALAARECGLGRTILFIGDGSMQLTVQELSTMIRDGTTPIIFLLNNSGYTIERCIHGKDRKYNDIVNWKWTSILNVLADPAGQKSKSYCVKTTDELSSLLEDENFQKADKVQLVEVVMDKYDAPRALEAQTKLGWTGSHPVHVV